MHNNTQHSSSPPPLSAYTPIAILGHGKYSTVVSARNSTTNTLYAVKVINKSMSALNTISTLTNSNSKPTYHNELQIIEYISQYTHNNIVNYHALFDSPSAVYIIQEISTLGELTPANFRYSTSPTSPTTTNQSIETVITSRILDMTAAIDFLHSLKIIHRDIKPANFLLFKNGRVKLTDFDTAYKLTTTKNTDKLALYSKPIGTPLFIPPELITTKSTPTQSKIAILTHKLNPFENSKSFNPYTLDIWSLGVSIYYLFYSTYPFYAENEYALQNKIVNEIPGYPENESLSFRISPIFKQTIDKILSSLLNKSPNQRFNISQINNLLGVTTPPRPKITNSPLKLVSINDENNFDFNHLAFIDVDDVDNQLQNQQSFINLPIFNTSSTSLPPSHQFQQPQLISSLKSKSGSLSSVTSLKHSSKMNFSKFNRDNNYLRKESKTIDDYLDSL